MIDVALTFRKLVFAQVLLGIIAFCLADNNPQILLVAGGLAALSWYIVEGPNGRPLPQWVILCGAAAAGLGLFLELVYRPTDNPVTALGHFTIWLQVLQLYGPKANRDYALLLVLSLLQMIGATAMSVSVVFGMLLVGYCVLSLFTLLLFQLKATSDTITDLTCRALDRREPIERLPAVVSPGYSWHLRLMGVGIGGICAVTALIVFIFFPRASSLLATTGQWGAPNPPRQVGFAQNVNLNEPSPAAVSREPVLNLVVRQGTQVIGEPGRAFYLRGVCLDQYDPLRRLWQRGSEMSRYDMELILPQGGRWLLAPPEQVPVLEAQFTVRMPGIQTLFTLFPPIAIESANFSNVVFNWLDQQITVRDPPPAHVAMVYTVRTPVWADRSLFLTLERLGKAESTPLVAPTDLPPGPWTYQESTKQIESSYARLWLVQTSLVRRLARQILQEAGIAPDQIEQDSTTRLRAAQALTEYLRHHYTYTPTGFRPTDQTDPVIDFLTRTRTGHCELFAAGLVALARSVGLPARMVSGFLAQDYNSIGGYYIVRQKDAHVWVEIDCGQAGWRMFDPTPATTLVEQRHRTTTWLTWLRDLYEHLEFTWLSTIVTYDHTMRSAMIQRLARPVREASRDPNHWLGASLQRIRLLWEARDVTLLSYLVAAGIVLFLGIALLSLIRIWLIRRRRLQALQLTRLPPEQRRQLARNLGFYLTMLDMLERHGFRRPAWQSPLAFARELIQREGPCLEPVLTLTHHFYEIRFGHRPLDERRRQEVRRALRQLEDQLAHRR